MTSTDDSQLPNVSSSVSLRQRLGCWVHERWRTEIALLRRRFFGNADSYWLTIHNRRESVSVDPVTLGWTCGWEHSSKLTVARVFPNVASRLMHSVIRCASGEVPSASQRPHNLPTISVIIPVGGTGRIRQFTAVLESLLKSTEIQFEILVIEQSPEPELQTLLPPHVQHHHAYASANAPFNKSWLINIGARHAKGKYLAIHDADYLVDPDYLRKTAAVLEHYQVARLGRFIFYLSESATFDFLSHGNFSRLRNIRHSVDSVVQNNPTPIAIHKDAYWEIGGHDESFFGWGGEDTEFLSRARTLNITEAGLLPLVHLWHPSAPKKASGDRNHQQQAEKLAIPPKVRCQILRELQLSDAAPVVADVSTTSSSRKPGN